MTGKLILCGTPIGNLEDASPRLARVLGEADAIACEDTRRTKKLLSHFGVTAKRLLVYNDRNERRQAPRLVELIAKGRAVALVSDAGMPGLSDPGYHLVRACIEKSVPIEGVPGPSAVLTALALSGFSGSRFVFEGFLPRRKAERQRRVAELSEEERTTILFESPARLRDTLIALAAVAPDREAVIARELTKLHEEVIRGTVAELAESLADDTVRGEIVLVLHGAAASRAEVSAELLARRARD
ncbi:MAG TPA: 16S rRNA (cytidine(1402)-2'-O)-methyltransferase, partial [Actinomycetota bacterium]|nr:16S rRNA (cytidine(1402)-2'-O)-methyltransferase [Actinomycetota bacterium]